MAKPKDIKLYEKAKMLADQTYKKHSAYKSMYIQKLYQSMGGEYINDNKSRKLSQWIKEEWKDIGNKDYPVYRPTKIISSTTPLTANEIDPENLKKQIRLKQKIRGSRNLPPFKSK